MADKRITQIGTTYTRDTVDADVDYLLGDRGGGSSYRIKVEEAVLGALEQTTGNVGIGTSSPVGELDIYTETSDPYATRLWLRQGAYYAGMVATDTGDGPALVWRNTDPFRFATISSTAFAGFTERMRISSTGALGLGTTSPVGEVDVYRASGSGPTELFLREGTKFVTLLADDTDGPALVWESSSDLRFSTASNTSYTGWTERIRVKSTGNVGIGTGVTVSYKLHVNGSVAGTSAYNNLSDLRRKTNTEPLDYGLNAIMQLRPIRFDYIDGERQQLGFGAQDVQPVIPEAISEADDGTLSLRESHIIAVLVNAVQELSQQVTALTQRVTELEQGAS